MKKLFFISREMCGGDYLPPDFDLDDFCERLQGKVTDIEVVPDHDCVSVHNRSDSLIDPRLILETVAECYPL